MHFLGSRKFNDTFMIQVNPTTHQLSNRPAVWATATAKDTAIHPKNITSWGKIHHKTKIHLLNTKLVNVTSPASMAVDVL